MPHRIFISHAAADAELARAVTELLRLGADASAREIFCTSLPATGIPSGQDFVDYVRDRLAGAELVVQLITPAYLDSAFCLCELGAQWVLAKDAFPLLVPPITYDDLQAVQRQIHVGRIDDGADLDKLFDRVCTLLGRDPGTVDWNVYRAQFMLALPLRLSSLKPATKVDAERYEVTRRAYEEQWRRAEELATEVDGLKRDLKKMAAAKTVQEVTEILVGDDEQAKFDALVDALRDALRRLPAPVTAVLQADLFSIEPNLDFGESAVRRALADGLLERGELSDEVQVWVNSNHRDVRRAESALEDLKRFEPSEALADSFEAVTGHRLDIWTHAVWKELRLPVYVEF
jgi:hypothetical protein